MLYSESKIKKISMAASIVFYIAIGICAILMSTCSTQAESSGLGEWCPTFWTPFREACYRLIAKPETWTEAETKCQQLGNGIIRGTEAHLVSIHNQDESDFVQAYYTSSAIVQGKRKKPSKPNSYNALWLGLTNQGPNLDTFVWSDKTEISTTFWQDTLYDTPNQNCGYTWTSSSSTYKGKWNDASCAKKLPYMCKLIPTKQADIVAESSRVLLPCSYRGTTIAHGDTLMLDECLGCTCDNATVQCNNITCPPTACEKELVKPIGDCCSVCPDEWNSCRYEHKNLVIGETLTIDDCTSLTCGHHSMVHIEIQPCEATICREPFAVDGECCEMCPYEVPVYDVQLSGDGVDSVQAGTVNDISVDLQVSLPITGQGVRGSGLWKVGMWASRNADGSGTKIGFEEQVFTNEQASKNMNRPIIFKGFEFNIPDINFSLDASNTTCNQMQYLCASFNKGDAPETLSRESQLLPLDVARFEVYGVESNDDWSPNPARLVGCQPFATCTDKERKCLIYSVV